MVVISIWDAMMVDITHQRDICVILGEFSIDKSVLDAMQKKASRIKIVSQERIVEELIKLCATAKPSVGLCFLENSECLLSIFFDLLENQVI